MRSRVVWDGRGRLRPSTRGLAGEAGRDSRCGCAAGRGVVAAADGTRTPDKGVPAVIASMAFLYFDPGASTWASRAALWAALWRSPSLNQGVERRTVPTVAAVVVRSRVEESQCVGRHSLGRLAHRTLARVGIGCRMSTGVFLGGLGCSRPMSPLPPKSNHHAGEVPAWTAAARRGVGVGPPTP